MMLRTLRALALSCAAATAAASEGAPIDNLAPEAGERFTPLGEPGRVERRGEGPVPMILIPGLDFGGGLFDSFVERNRESYTLFSFTPLWWQDAPRGGLAGSAARRGGPRAPLRQSLPDRPGGGT